MHVKSGAAQAVIDGVAAAEGMFKVHLPGEEIEVEVEMVYFNSKTGSTYGTCPVKSNLLSKETMESFRVFLRNVEMDFSGVVFDGATATPFGVHTGTLGAENRESRSLGDGLPPAKGR